MPPKGQCSPTFRSMPPTRWRRYCGTSGVRRPCRWPPACPFPLNPKPPVPTLRMSRGSRWPRRAAEVAAAGGHNLLLLGSPGSGKSMIAQRLPSILPELSFEESIETTQIHSIAGLAAPRESRCSGTVPSGRLITPFRRQGSPVAAPIPVPARSVWPTTAYCSWTSCRSFPGRRWKPCASPWRTAG